MSVKTVTINWCWWYFLCWLIEGKIKKYKLQHNLYFLDAMYYVMKSAAFGSWHFHGSVHTLDAVLDLNLSVA